MHSFAANTCAYNYTHCINKMINMINIVAIYRKLCINAIKWLNSTHTVLISSNMAFDFLYALWKLHNGHNRKEKMGAFKRPA